MAFRPISLPLSLSLSLPFSVSFARTRTQKSTKQRKTVFLCPKNARLLYGKSCAKKIVVNFLQRRPPDCLRPAEPSRPEPAPTAGDCLLGFLRAHISSCSHLSPPEVILIRTMQSCTFLPYFTRPKLLKEGRKKQLLKAVGFKLGI